MSLASRIKNAFSYDRAWREPFNRALIATGKGDWDQAIVEYTEVLHINPHSVEALFNRAVNYFRKNDWENAAADFTETLRIQPKHLKALHWRGLSRRAQKRYEEALNDLGKEIESQPQNGCAYYEQGVTYRLMPDFPKALASLSKAIELGFDAHFERGFVQLNLGSIDFAKNDFTEAILLSPDSRLYFNRAILFYRCNDLDAAIADTTEAIRLDPGNPMYHASRAFYYHAKGNYDEAIVDDFRTLEMDDKNVKAHNGLAWIFATCPEDRLRNGEKAVEHALKAVALSEEKVLACIGTLAAAYAEAGNFEEAVRWKKKFLESNPPKENIEPALLRLRLFEQGKPYREIKGHMETVADKPRLPE